MVKTHEDLMKILHMPSGYLKIDNDIALYYEKDEDFIYIESVRVDNESWSSLYGETIKKEEITEELLLKIIKKGIIKLEELKEKRNNFIKLLKKEA